ncbi:hypothetical protein V9T40_009471 [Parthenolecanium corni]|uniref:Uncharacterized protein n=1 Tax=Parthenolecanium corni TaxID=536013 RepID=A0AAN9Y934_9HEMI
MYAEINKVVLISLVFASCTSAAPAKKNIHFRECKKSDPNFLQCFQSELQRVIPELKDGFAKFRIPPIDPFDLPGLQIAKGSGAVAIDLNLQKVKIGGLSSAQILNLQVDPNKLEGSARLGFSKPINIVGSYTAKGKVQVLAINGKGPCNITLFDPQLELYNLKGEVVEKNGIKHIVIKSASLKVTKVSKISLQLENLFQGNPELSKNLNVFLNENWQLLFDELKPAFEEAIIAIVKDIVGKALAKIPADRVFPA